MKATALIMPFVFAMTGYLFASVADHESRIHSIEESRFTNHDAAKMELSIMQRTPPEWLKVQVSEIKVLLLGIDERLRAVEQKP